MSRLHFSINSAQAFIAPSRRTRDLWVSSYLLSYLSGRAMAAVCELDEGNQILLPAIGREELKRYGDSKYGSTLPAHATLPNRFIAEVRDGRAAGQAATKALQAAWEHIANCVWERCVKDSAYLSARDGQATQEIWERQVGGFWDIAWVVAEGPATDNEPALLDARKHWRTREIQTEPGQHCTMMGAYQELSGYERSREAEPFWQDVRGRVRDLNLLDDERLCAIALIKRMLPEVGKRALGRDLRADVVSWPSTLYVAAWPWIKEVCRINPDAAARYADIAATSRDGQKALGEMRVCEALAKSLHPIDRNAMENAGNFARLEGNYFFVNALANPNATPLNLDDERRKGLVDALHTLIADTTKRPPSPFFALVLMDGDQLGALLRDAVHDDARYDKVTQALTDFTAQVPEIVAKYEGHTIYAGGDDVLALLPIDTALVASVKLRQVYSESFKKQAARFVDRATISAAVLYAHYHLPLRRLINAAHTLLDEVAKEQTGRDSVALAIHKSSGMTALFAAPWTHICPDLSPGYTLLSQVCKHLEEKAFGKSALYRLRAVLSRVVNARETGPGVQLAIPAELDLDSLRDLIAAELASDRERPATTREQLEAVAQTLQEAMHWMHRGPDGKVHRRHMISMDAAMIAAFLAEKGADEDRP